MKERSEKSTILAHNNHKKSVQKTTTFTITHLQQK